MNSILNAHKIVHSFTFTIAVSALTQATTLNTTYADVAKAAHAKVLVAVIDTGADITHPDLKKHIWTNPGESGTDAVGRNKATNGIDDDGDGLIDDVHGWNFATGSNDVGDRHGHGTHIAGIIASSLPTNSSEVELVILKYFDPKRSGEETIAATAAAIRFATRIGVKVINYSAGGTRPNGDERAAIEEAGRAGVLVVAAAGNEASNSDIAPYYPADYGLSNIISVTAHNDSLQILSTSNFGSDSVDLAAPGDSIRSSLPHGEHGELTGTSQATAFVTAAVAQILTHYRGLDEPSQILQSLLSGADKYPSLNGKTRDGSALNLNRSLAIRGHGLDVSDAIAVNTPAHYPSDYAAYFASEVPRPPSLP